MRTMYFQSSQVSWAGWNHRLGYCNFLQICHSGFFFPNWNEGSKSITLQFVIIRFLVKQYTPIISFVSDAFEVMSIAYRWSQSSRVQASSQYSVRSSTCYSIFWCVNRMFVTRAQTHAPKIERPRFIDGSLLGKLSSKLPETQSPPWAILKPAVDSTWCIRRLLEPRSALERKVTFPLAGTVECSSGIFQSIEVKSFLIASNFARENKGDCLKEGFAENMD